MIGVVFVALAAGVAARRVGLAEPIVRLGVFGKQKCAFGRLRHRAVEISGLELEARQISIRRGEEGRLERDDLFKERAGRREVFAVELRDAQVEIDRRLVRGEGEGLLVGMSDPHETTGFKLTESDGWLAGLGEAIEHRAPAISDVGLCAGWAGLYEMTPDCNALIGEADAGFRLLYAAGFSGHGFLQAPAVGACVRDLYLGRAPVIDVSCFDASRFLRPARRTEIGII